MQPKAKLQNALSASHAGGSRRGEAGGPKSGLGDGNLELATLTGVLATYLRLLVPLDGDFESLILYVTE